MMQPLWTPSEEQKAQSRMAAFIRLVGERHGLDLADFQALHRFSVERQEDFWNAAWDFCGVKASVRGTRVLVDGDKMPGARYFPDARLNYAENALRRRDSAPAIIFRGEDKVRSELSWAELHDAVGRMARALRRAGVKPGDRIAAVVPNMPETTVAFLGTVAIGAIWSSCSPDFGERGILDRFGQIEPKVLVVCDGYFYNGKQLDITDKIAHVLTQLPTIETVVVIDYTGAAEAAVRKLPKAATYGEFLGHEPVGEIAFEQVPFDHPIFILFSSGTTGVPKCIVHRTGGIILKHLTEHQLHGNIRAGDRFFYFSTCGWMMWNWLMSGLMSEATLVLYDGSPFAPSERVLFDYAEEVGMTQFGTSAKYVDALKKTGWRPIDTHKLPALRTMFSTGSPLAPESFAFVYAGIKPGIHLASISGGTDLCGCFVGGNPLAPVYEGEIQSPMLGNAVDVFDDEGRPLPRGKGELVCAAPFPSMPVMFWNDPTGEKYFNAYFARFPNVWTHGDFAEWTEHGGMIIHGRSDATLNPGGVRIGTAEIYAQVEQIPEVIEAIAIGQDWDGDVRVVLFVRLREGVALSEDLVKRIKTQIRTGASPRHVPAKVIAIADIPRTKSGKITEIAVRDVIHGREVKNREALANPEALDLYKDLPALRD
ncbi:acetoacetate--CoA ligase [Rhodoligotrophos defluvii]|uniref:acetoacetate--CoA ligase n=1 Tax=Rhodoligotrophos defluvii TaxID=2561934 RepID=UPI001EF1229C|nr:acetoacetate--CoA ligase [Rhodoligotrophos defluvii]